MRYTLKTLALGVLVILFPLACKSEDSSYRMVVMDSDSAKSDSILQTLKGLGANSVATNPDPDISAALKRNGMKYIVYLSAANVERLNTDSAWLASITALGADGYHYMDEVQDGHPVEGYTSIAVQVQTYKTLKQHFPSAVVLYAFRLDPQMGDLKFLDQYLTVEGSDILAPYFYPVGTPFGALITYDGPWENLLRSQVAPFAAKVGNHRVMPVLQAFTYVINGTNDAVGPDFLVRQQAVYKSIFPEIHDAAVFDWGGGAPSETLIDMAHDVGLQQSVGSLFSEMISSGRASVIRPIRTQPKHVLVITPREAQ